jgi:hypothetical protein
MVSSYEANAHHEIRVSLWQVGNYLGVLKICEWLITMKKLLLVLLWVRRA